MRRKCFICGSMARCRHKERILLHTSKLDPSRGTLLGICTLLMAREHRSMELARGEAWDCICTACVRTRDRLAEEIAQENFQEISS